MPPTAGASAACRATCARQSPWRAPPSRRARARGSWGSLAGPRRARSPDRGGTARQEEDNEARRRSGAGACCRDGRGRARAPAHETVAASRRCAARGAPPARPCDDGTPGAPPSFSSECLAGAVP
eukprot:891393-Prymnesium_polylepis.1